MGNQLEKTEMPIKKSKAIGEITHYFNKLGVAVVALNANLKIGDQIVISGHGREFVQPVDSMQVEHEQVAQAKPGDSVGLKVDQEVKAGDEVSLVA
ncbi:MAG: hypothetical protein RB292_04155 [Patescibacteria group bacterium]|jgi:translation elongation factor EF-1alpha|nr:hypothetical protein [Patescibacteria group bacterium]